MKASCSILLLALFSFGCGSSVRFTSDNSKKPETNSTPATGKEEGATQKEKIPLDGNVLATTTGVASFYGEKFHGRKTANGEIYDMNQLTAAHQTLPFNTVVRVTNLLNNRSVNVRINDRKPDFHGRIIDLSYAAAKELDMVIKGITEVKIDVIELGKNE